ncbi:hypothetical protein K469DRAFT_698276 [Zopfia rhizophila CBS 207.26]|uniref:Uncharacterized protein n=1 Tax=Zopfia rhizophila CBS 207.26 TaxID=1314779 RepID=A0A6A6DB68_9PEZI|nr:hypothetical protein K469DRAFT_698276 [Zopfia rhizophila CBS 207.26]
MASRLGAGLTDPAAVTSSESLGRLSESLTLLPGAGLADPAAVRIGSGVALDLFASDITEGACLSEGLEVGERISVGGGNGLGESLSRSAGLGAGLTDPVAVAGLQHVVGFRLGLGSGENLCGGLSSAFELVAGLAWSTARAGFKTSEVGDHGSVCLSIMLGLGA